MKFRIRQETCLRSNSKYRVELGSKPKCNSSISAHSCLYGGAESGKANSGESDGMAFTRSGISFKHWGYLFWEWPVYTPTLSLILMQTHLHTFTSTPIHNLARHAFRSNSLGKNKIQGYTAPSGSITNFLTGSSLKFIFSKFFPWYIYFFQL